jgi:heme/copper-type cytochrome/quinol oxidase subunit 3
MPNQLYKKAAEREDVRGVRLWLTVAFLFALAFLAVRGLEFTTLNIRWDSNAYGSIVWWLMGLHTLHIATDVADTAVLLAIILVRTPRGRRFVDVSENGFYWYFVVLSWIPIYVVVYFVPRWS